MMRWRPRPRGTPRVYFHLVGCSQGSLGYAAGPRLAIQSCGQSLDQRFHPAHPRTHLAQALGMWRFGMVGQVLADAFRPPALAPVADGVDGRSKCAAYFPPLAFPAADRTSANLPSRLWSSRRQGRRVPLRIVCFCHIKTCRHGLFSKYIRKVAVLMEARVKRCVAM